MITAQQELRVPSLIVSTARTNIWWSGHKSSSPARTAFNGDESSYIIEQLKNSLIQNTNYLSRQLENNNRGQRQWSSAAHFHVGQNVETERNQNSEILILRA